MKREGRCQGVILKQIRFLCLDSTITIEMKNVGCLISFNEKDKG